MYVKIKVEYSIIIVKNYILITDLPDCSSPIINSLNVGLAKYQFIKPEIKVNII